MTDFMKDLQARPGQEGHIAVGRDRASMVPPFSPVLLGGLLLAPVPDLLLRPLLRAVMAAVAKQHPGMFERLGSSGDTVFLIDPIDLPIRFLLQADAEKPKLTIARQTDAPRATAAIRGSLLALIDLLEGRVDGDALFFSRRLLIEGDTEAVVALRNAVDGEEINIIDDILVRAGPLARPARRAAKGFLRLARRAGADIAMLQDALLQPAMERVEAQTAATDHLRQSMARGNASRRRRASKTPAVQE
jgi:predicted lipid carrier protein YhbT